METAALIDGETEVWRGRGREGGRAVRRVHGTKTADRCHVSEVERSLLMGFHVI